ncbi:ferredoxin-NADP reductase [Kitasatospora sp. GP30]|uniref:PDR/VanB family oxidoreductase n=1 Tax=Kitasatospora sp. GP30 TaxID=3035084 RepID=UPI000C709AB5|nr:PDR/VanB family oxidoreductase [Kitasatospora sp. GP30]MDH6139644.1 ferredoxin-NADP reductase [Kitasatospora sp. GP30]
MTPPAADPATEPADPATEPADPATEPAAARAAAERTAEAEPAAAERAGAADPAPAGRPQATGPAPTLAFGRTSRHDLDTPPPDLYGRPRADRFFSLLTRFSDLYTPALASPPLRRSPRRPPSRGRAPLVLVVTAHRPVADDVVELRLADPAGSPLPPWQPGAHLQLTLPSGRVRHYSLCGDPADRGGYRIAVRRIAGGGGGSVEIHDELHVGARLTVRRPRNGFVFCAEPKLLLIAGGIGITPLLPIARDAQHRGLDWQLVYAGRSAETMPFTEELTALASMGVPPAGGWGRVTLLVGGTPTGEQLLARAGRGAAVYCCGPTPMLAAVQQAFDASPATALHFERFGAAPVRDGRSFTLKLSGSGEELAVPADKSALDVLREARPGTPYSCHQGFCGTCQVRVLAGTPEHRDRRLTAEERAAGALLPCVSRAAEGETLVLEV